MNEFETILPPNSTELEVAVDETIATRLDAVETPIIDLIDIDACPAGFLPFLAWGLSVEDWDSNWSDTQKRQVIKSTYQIHQTKGTVYAVEAALAALDIPAILEEWFNYGGDPYHYRIALDLSGRGADFSELQSLYNSVLKAANVRSVMDALQIYLTRTDKAPMIAAACTSGQSLTIYPMAQDALDLNDPLYIGMGAGAYNIVTIYPQEAGQ